MNKDLEMKINGVEKEILSAQQTLEKAEGRLKGLKEELEKLKEMKKVPMIHLKHNKPAWFIECDLGYEIMKYHKYSDKYIEFETSQYKFRFIEAYKSENCEFPMKTYKTTLHKNIEYIFEIYDVVCKEYKPCAFIDHIELLEGVDVYDKA